MMAAAWRGVLRWNSRHRISVIRVTVPAKILVGSQRGLFREAMDFGMRAESQPGKGEMVAMNDWFEAAALEGAPGGLTQHIPARASLTVRKLSILLNEIQLALLEFSFENHSTANIP